MINTQIFARNSKQIIFALFAISNIGMAVPVRADDALIQDSIQESVVTGKDNVSVQNSSQTNQQYREYRARSRYGHSYEQYSESGNTGIVQRSEQYCDQIGEYNTCVQDAQQSNISNTRRLRRSGR